METSAENRINTHRIEVLDGIRAIAILIIVWYHIWQQSWLAPYISTPFLQQFGVRGVSLDIIPRSGYLFVDLMLLLSAFCLFLPYAREALLGEKKPDTLVFYQKRVARIVPCYWLCVLLLFFCYALPTGAYSSVREALRDLLPTLTFTQTFVPAALIGTKINGVLWTVAIEMQFYLIFPFLAKAFQKKPAVTYLAMVAVGALYLRLYALTDYDTLRLTVNQLPGFFGVFANGMLGAYLFVALAKHQTRHAALSVSGTLVFVFSLFLLGFLLRGAAASAIVQVFQARFRYLLSVVFLVMILSAAISARWLRFLLGNRLMTFLAGVSYNVYIWHQWIAVRLKEWHFPDWSGDTLPNMQPDRVWQQRYTWLVFGVSVAVAVLITHCFEKPLTTQIMKCRIYRKDTIDGTSV